MSNDLAASAAHEEKVNEIIAAYLQAVQAGQVLYVVFKAPSRVPKEQLGAAANGTQAAAKTVSLQP